MEVDAHRAGGPRLAQVRVAVGRRHAVQVTLWNVIRRLIKTAVPVSRVGVALWAWHNRDEILDWAGFVAGAGPRVVEGKGGDVVAEARLRLRLTTDARTRSADRLRVSVHDGVATLSGVVEPAVHDAALDLATVASGVRKVRDDLAHPSGQTRFSFA